MWRMRLRTAQASLPSVHRARILVAAWPNVYATVLAAGLRTCDAYEVAVADLALADWEPTGSYDAVLTSVPVPATWAEVVLQLQASLEDPVRVTIGGLTVERHLDEPTIDGVVDLLERCLADLRARHG